VKPREIGANNASSVNSCWEKGTNCENEVRHQVLWIEYFANK